MIDVLLNDGTKIKYNSFDEMDDYHKHQIVELDCNKNNLKMIPECICSMVNLKKLYCYDNQLTALPSLIGYFEYTN
jgi:Leucine-rich repeat (LRR) protein